jgi:hypothetical protein
MFCILLLYYLIPYTLVSTIIHVTGLITFLIVFLFYFSGCFQVHNLDCYVLKLLNHIPNSININTHLEAISQWRAAQFRAYTFKPLYLLQLAQGWRCFHDCINLWTFFVTPLVFTKWEYNIVTCTLYSHCDCYCTFLFSYTFITSQMKVICLSMRYRFVLWTNVFCMISYCFLRKLQMACGGLA